ncbi:hypothetical protein VHTUMSATKI_04550 [Vibrio harveyi]
MLAYRHSELAQSILDRSAARSFERILLFVMPLLFSDMGTNYAKRSIDTTAYLSTIVTLT